MIKINPNEEKYREPQPISERYALVDINYQALQNLNTEIREALYDQPYHERYGSVSREALYASNLSLHETLQSVDSDMLPEAILLYERGSLGGIALTSEVAPEDRGIELIPKIPATFGYFLPRTQERLRVKTAVGASQSRYSPDSDAFIGFAELREAAADMHRTGVTIHSVEPISTDREVDRLGQLQDDEIRTIVAALADSVKDTVARKQVAALQVELASISAQAEKTRADKTRNFADLVRRRLSNLSKAVQVATSKKLQPVFSNHVWDDDKKAYDYTRARYFLPDEGRLVIVPLSKTRFSKVPRPIFKLAEDAPEKDWVDPGVVGIGDKLLKAIPERVHDDIYYKRQRSS